MQSGETGALRLSLTARWPLFAAIALLFAIGLPRYLEAVHRNDGRWVYPLDDTYISLAVANTFASTGIWGLTPNSGFSFGTSAPLYPVLLAGFFRFTGVHEITPLLVNLAVGLILLWWIEARLRREPVSARVRFVVLAAVILLTPLHLLILSGMEHTIQTLLSVIFLFDGTEALTRPQGTHDPKRDRRLTLRLAITAFLLTGIRYEGLFLVFIVCCLLLLRRAWRLAFFLGGIALLPPLIFGLISKSMGWKMLPNSVLLKATTPGAGLGTFLATGLQQLTANPHMYALALAFAVALFFQTGREGSFWKPRAVRLVLWLALLALHMQFAKTGWVFRYEAYLVATGLVLLGTISLPSWRAAFSDRELRAGQAAACFFFALFALWPLAARGHAAHNTVARASTNIYEQQYQMARFLRQFYPEATVAANDVGVITFLTNINCIDLFGLTSKEVLLAKRAGKFNSVFIRRLARKRNVEIAIVYDWWYDVAGGIPPSWTKVGEWKIFHNAVLGGDVVSFYAVKPELAADLASKLREFSPQLPKTVEQRGAYLDP
jgi:hypothetical protein